MSSRIHRLRNLGRGWPRQLPYLGPLLAWMAVIAVLSSDLGSAEHTTGYLSGLARWLLPSVGSSRLEPVISLLSALIRKLAHLCEYAVLALLACRWVRFSFHPPQRTWQQLGLAIAIGYAALDELRQRLVPSRSGSASDVLLDLVGAVVGAVLFTWWVARAVRRQRSWDEGQATL